jgi:hypothetical protein
MTWLLTIILVFGNGSAREVEIGVFHYDGDCYISGVALSTAASIDTGLKTVFRCEKIG